MVGLTRQSWQGDRGGLEHGQHPPGQLVHPHLPVPWKSHLAVRNRTGAPLLGGRPFTGSRDSGLLRGGHGEGLCSRLGSVPTCREVCKRLSEKEEGKRARPPPHVLSCYPEERYGRMAGSAHRAALLRKPRVGGHRTDCGGGDGVYARARSRAAPGRVPRQPHPLLRAGARPGLHLRV